VGGEGGPGCGLGHLVVVEVAGGGGDSGGGGPIEE